MPQMNTDTRTYRYDVGPDTGPYRNELDTDTWLYRNGIGPYGAGAGRGRPGPRHRKPPSRRMRRAAAASAIVLAGGGAAAGLLYATGPQPPQQRRRPERAHGDLGLPDRHAPGGGDDAGHPGRGRAGRPRPTCPGTPPRAAGTPP